MTLSRRDFIATAAALGATASLAAQAAPSRVTWRERRDLYPEGVASGDPDSGSVILWTRCPSGKRLTVELAEDKEFRRVVATRRCAPSPETDWTVRVLVADHNFMFAVTAVDLASRFLKTCAEARPSFNAVSAVTGSRLAVPRTPSVPKIFWELLIFIDG